MRVFDETKTIEYSMNLLDLKNGELKEDTLIVHHDEVKAVEEEWHYETIKTYANGGKDVRKVIDKEGVEYKPAYDEEEKIYVYRPFTNDEIIHKNAVERIEQLKGYLAETDYIAIKYAEGIISLVEYNPIRERRIAWRQEINDLEAL